jgi:O-antigen/teichoic acid export membrane protein
MVAGNLVIAALGQAAGPRLAQYYAINNRRAFRTLLARLIFIGLGLGGLALLVARLFGREILTLLYEADYAQHADVLVWLAGAAGISFMASFLGYAMTAARYFRVQIALQLASLSTVTLGCLVLVPKMGMIGAAQSILLGSVVQLLGGLGVNIIALRHMGTGSRSDAG